MLSNRKHTKISRLLSYILRHNPQEFGLTLDNQGWVKVDDLLKSIWYKKQLIPFEDLKEVVANCEKQRFSFDETRTKIRANQGHSVEVDIEYKKEEPPEFLYHGTATKNISSIHKEGIKRMERRHVHLCKEKETAFKVGKRHGTPVICVVQSKKMFKDGITFYLTANKIWLVDHVPPQYISEYEWKNGDQL
jgi:putative RNA 2'-phosphotransferase